MGGNLAKDRVYSSGSSSSSVSETKFTTIDPPSIQNATAQSTGDSSQNASIVVKSTNITNAGDGDSSQNATAVVQSSNITNSGGESSQNVTAVVQSGNTNQPGVFQGLIERVQRTMRGSADDIGWLQRDPDMPPVEDGTEKFMEILDEIRLVELLDSTLEKA